MIIISVSIGKAQCTIKDYSTFKNILRVDGDYVQTYDTFRRIYKIDGSFLLAYNTYKKLLKKLFHPIHTFRAVVPQKSFQNPHLSRPTSKTIL